jgi:hypothetical protein
MTSSSLDELMERTRSLISAAYENIVMARELREVSRSIRCDNSDLREFLREAHLLVLRRHQETNSAQLNFILTELSTGMTFASIAPAMEGKAQARNRAHARVAYDSVLRFLERVTMTREQLEEVHADIALLKQRLQTLGEEF